ncbi:MAG: enoyl-CoA hydratase/isomerase family protein [Porticoccaceae bacterium]|jgi:methylglutaconyl-CoA hydratase|nr:enoyl-CoA hydratase/isomerase family protein [Porticoccaceae bacterium]MBT3797281.1 enoyl-CoA hydratase/isomerase family protein [Porticoccaceae bacterium]MBT4164957.1 enoyl-CoA hydratase/isomerase family protein [Porticoccaceae bacterium]MBT4210393.1 enoyl-CoA hydratase/isomerase family protein [Porticoccaceae bacterium]MBT6421432.1 enoyl-CoA hydratase/isomerase family protein [Porticoccaceae bacterium]
MDKVTTQIDNRGVAQVTLNNPNKHNAFDDQMIIQLTDAFNSITANPAVRLMLLTSEGKSFSAGADLSWMKRMAGYSYQENLNDAHALAAMLKTLHQIPIPTIARVQGAAFGGAVGLISCCDIAVASSKASFALSEVKIGLVPSTISPYVIAAIGERQAKRYFMTAERFDPNTAMQIGLVHEAVDEQLLDDKIEQLVGAILSNGPEAVAAAKQLVFAVSGKAIDSPLIEHTSEIIAGIRVSGQGQEGLNAFLEKRKPNWLKD